MQTWMISFALVAAVQGGTRPLPGGQFDERGQHSASPVFQQRAEEAKQHAGNVKSTQHSGNPFASRVQETAAGNIAEELTKAGATTLVDLVVKAGLADTLSTAGPFTVFAPTNAAFAALDPALLATLGGDVELLKKVLLYHVVSGEVYSTDVQNDVTVPSVEGTPLRTNIYNGVVTVNGKEVVQADLKASNGVIHQVSEVIYPFASSNIAELVTSDSRFSTLLAAVGAAGLAETLSGAGPFTVFAPTNDAFAKVPAEDLNGLLADKDALTKVLLRHVVPGTVFAKGVQTSSVQTAGGEQIDIQVEDGAVSVASEAGSAQVILVDIIANNGVIHAIDTVI